MIISWFGHSCFRLESKDVSILIDPFSKEIGLRPPKIKDNIVLLTHLHYDHADTKEAPPETKIVNGPGEYEMQGIYIKGIQSYHDNSNGAERGLNTIYVIQAEEINICHMGDFGQAKPEEHQLEEIGDVDVLMLPVGGTYTIDGKQAAEIVNQIEPKIIIPMHYKLPDLKIDIAGADKFLKEIGLKAETVDKLKVTKKTLPQEEIKLIMFQM